MIVELKSFSLKKGYPETNNEVDRGFIFDCRGLQNPGRLDQFKELSGLDSSVAEWIQNNTAHKEYLNNIIGLIDHHINVSLKRKIKSVSIFFGCTGGQHRSVFMCEQLYDYLSSNPDIKVQITHIEKNNWPIPAAKERKW